MPDLHAFRFIGGPIDESTNASVLFLELGKAATAWARLEQQIEAILLHINKQDFSDKLFKVHPVSFTKKLNILKKWFIEHPALSSHKEPFLEIASKLWNLANERNLYLHSILEDFDAMAKIAVFHRILPENDGKFKLIMSEVHVEQISAFTDVVNAINRYLWSLSESIFTVDTVSMLESS